MNETIYIVEMFRVCFVCCFFGKKEERMLKRKHDISDGLFGATGIIKSVSVTFMQSSWLIIKKIYHW